MSAVLTKDAADECGYLTDADIQKLAMGRVLRAVEDAPQHALTPVVLSQILSRAAAHAMRTTDWAHGTYSGVTAMEAVEAACQALDACAKELA